MQGVWVSSRGCQVSNAGGRLEVQHLPRSWDLTTHLESKGTRCMPLISTATALAIWFRSAYHTLPSNPHPHPPIPLSNKDLWTTCTMLMLTSTATALAIWNRSAYDTSGYFFLMGPRMPSAMDRPELCVCVAMGNVSCVGGQRMGGGAQEAQRNGQAWNVKGNAS